MDGVTYFSTERPPGDLAGERSMTTKPSIFRVVDAMSPSAS